MLGHIDMEMTVMKEGVFILRSLETGGRGAPGSIKPGGKGGQWAEAFIVVCKMKEQDRISRFRTG